MNALASWSVQAKLVRRELRSLDDDERERYFAALQTLYKYSQEEGEQIYGAGYKSASWLVRQHIYGAAQQDCDHCASRRSH